MSVDQTTLERHPLGLPPGSVRGLLSLMIMIGVWLILLLPDSYLVKIPLNVYFLLPLVVLYFFSHGKSIATRSDPMPSPWYLPGGTFRFLILGGTLLVLGYVYYDHPARLESRIRPTTDMLDSWGILLSALFGGLTVGYLIKFLPGKNHWMFQAIQAWLSMISLFTLLAEVLIQAFIYPKITEAVDLAIWQGIVTFLAAAYYGTRT